MVSYWLHAGNWDCLAAIEFDFKVVYYPPDHYLCPGSIYDWGGYLCLRKYLCGRLNWSNDPGDWYRPDLAANVCGGYADFPATKDRCRDGGLCFGNHVCPGDRPDADRFDPRQVIMAVDLLVVCTLPFDRLDFCPNFIRKRG